MALNIMLLDDDVDIHPVIQRLGQLNGWNVHCYSNGIDALVALKKFLDPSNKMPHLDLVIADVNMPDMNGLAFAENVKKLRSSIPVIIITSNPRVEDAIKAIRTEISDFLVKPLKLNDLKDSVLRLLMPTHQDQPVPVVRAPVRLGDSLIGGSPKMVELFDLIQRVGPTTANVLITGESGTGKEMVARALHKHSGNANRPFIAINCSAIPETLLESELFGHSKGSFTGAISSRKGLIEEANGGTLFLDEIGDMTMALQAKLLRVLQEKSIKPVGDNQYRRVDVRFIAATHHNLKEGIKENRFREDLFYRLNVIPISIPPLRERPEDITVLIEHFARVFSNAHGMPEKKFTKKALSRMVSQRWTGNVRELENFVERCLILSPHGEIDEKDLFTVGLNQEGPVHSPEETDLLPLKEIEKRYIAYILGKTGGKREKAAQILKIDRKTLYRKACDYGFQKAHVTSFPKTPPAGAFDSIFH